MTKKEFVEKLCIGLKNLPADEAQQTVMFYSEAIDDRIEEGMSEEDAVAAMGSVEDIVREIGGTDYTAEEAKEEPEGDSRNINDYTASADVKSVAIMRGFKVRAAASHDGRLHLSTSAGEGFKAVMEANGTLSVRRVEDEQVQGDFQKLRSVQDILNFIGSNIASSLKNFATIDLNMEIPEHADFTATISGGSDFKAAGIELKNVNVKGTSSDIDMTDIGCEDLDITTSSGDIDLERIRCRRINITSTSGDIDADDISASSGIQLHSTSGDIDVENSEADSIGVSSTSGDLSVMGTRTLRMAASSTSGDVELVGTAVEEKLGVNTVSGDIDVELKTQCPIVKFEAVSGEIDAILTGDYRVSAHSVSGGCKISSPNSDAAENIATANTVSGHINISCR